MKIPSKTPSKSRRVLRKFNRAISKSTQLFVEQVGEQYEGLMKLIGSIHPALYKKEIEALTKKLEEERARYADEEREHQMRENQLKVEMKRSALEYQHELSDAGKDFRKRESLMGQRISELERQLASTHQLYSDSQTHVIREHQRAESLMRVTGEQAEHISALQGAVYHLSDKTFRNGLANFFQKVFRRENGLLMVGADMKIIRANGSALETLGYSGVDFAKKMVSIEEILCAEDKQVFKDGIARLNVGDAKGFQYEAGLRSREQTIEEEIPLLSPFSLKVTAEYNDSRKGEDNLALLWVNLTRVGTSSNYFPKSEIIPLKRDLKSIDKDVANYVSSLKEKLQTGDKGYVLDFSGMGEMDDEVCKQFCQLLSVNNRFCAINVNKLPDRQYSFFKYTGLGAERLGFARLSFLQASKSYSAEVARAH